MLPTIGIIYIVGKLLYRFTASMARPGGALWPPFKVDGGSSRWTTRYTDSHRWSTRPISQIPRDLHSSCTQIWGHRADCASLSSRGRRSRGSMEPHDELGRNRTGAREPALEGQAEHGEGETATEKDAEKWKSGVSAEKDLPNCHCVTRRRAQTRV